MSRQLERLADAQVATQLEQLKGQLQSFAMVQVTSGPGKPLFISHALRPAT